MGPWGWFPHSHDKGCAQGSFSSGPVDPAQTALGPVPTQELGVPVLLTPSLLVPARSEGDGSSRHPHPPNPY